MRVFILAAGQLVFTIHLSVPLKPQKRSHKWCHTNFCRGEHGDHWLQLKAHAAPVHVIVKVAVHRCACLHTIRPFRTGHPQQQSIPSRVHPKRQPEQPSL